MTSLAAVLRYWSIRTVRVLVGDRLSRLRGFISGQSISVRRSSTQVTGFYVLCRCLKLAVLWMLKKSMNLHPAGWGYPSKRSKVGFGDLRSRPFFILEFRTCSAIHSIRCRPRKLITTCMYCTVHEAFVQFIVSLKNQIQVCTHFISSDGNRAGSIAGL